MKHRDNYTAAVLNARKLFLRYDCAALARKLNIHMDESYLYPFFIGETYRISRATGEISRQLDGEWVDANSFNETLTLFDLVCDSTEDRCTVGRERNMGDFGTRVHQGLLEQKEPWADELQRNGDRFDAACKNMGAKVYPIGDRAWAFPLFEELHVVLQLWYGDEEFSAQIRWLWDENALKYLKYETMYYAVALIRTRIEEAMH